MEVMVMVLRCTVSVILVMCGSHLVGWLVKGSRMECLRFAFLLSLFLWILWLLVFAFALNVALLVY